LPAQRLPNCTCPPELALESTTFELPGTPDRNSTVTPSPKVSKVIFQVIVQAYDCVATEKNIAAAIKNNFIALLFLLMLNAF
jgi:hypothetical protein